MIAGTLARLTESLPPDPAEQDFELRRLRREVERLQALVNRYRFVPVSVAADYTRQAFGLPPTQPAMYARQAVRT